MRGWEKFDNQELKEKIYYTQKTLPRYCIEEGKVVNVEKNYVNFYEQKNIKPFGGGRNEDESSQALILDLKGGQRLALLGYNESCPSGECASGKIPGAKRFSETVIKTLLD